MEYEGDIIRPPSEAFSIILQVTTGCSHNHCTFCGAYRDRDFRIKSWARIEADLDFAARWCQRQRTLFLADGDALALPTATMLTLLARIRQRLPWVRRVSSYATCQNILALADPTLARYRELGLSRLYMGLESGHDTTLQRIGKGAESTAMIEAGRRVTASGIFLSVTCLLGIAGLEASLDHARATAAVLSRMQPHQIAILTLMLLPNTPLFRLAEAGRFILPDRWRLLEELRTMVAELAPFRTQLAANHASNYLNLSGRLPKDRDRLLAEIDAAAAGTRPLQAEAWRRL